MRISDKQNRIIQNAAKQVYGDNVHIYLYGSRVYDDTKGGDIDLMVKADFDKMTSIKKVLFLVELKKQLGDRKIDVVYDKHSIQNKFFLNTIKQQAIQLC